MDPNAIHSFEFVGAHQASEKGKTLEITLVISVICLAFHEMSECMHNPQISHPSHLLPILLCFRFPRSLSQVLVQTAEHPHHVARTFHKKEIHNSCSTQDELTLAFLYQQIAEFLHVPGCS